MIASTCLFAYHLSKLIDIETRLESEKEDKKKKRGEEREKEREERGGGETRTHV